MKLIFGILCDSSICGNSYSDICLYRWQSYYDLFSYNVENTYSYMPLSFALNPRRKGPLRTYYLNEQTGQLEDQSDLPNVQDSECDAHGTQKTLCDDEVRSDTAVNRKYFYVPTSSGDTCPIEPELNVCLLVSVMILLFRVLRVTR